MPAGCNANGTDKECLMSTGPYMGKTAVQYTVKGSDGTCCFDSAKPSVAND